MEANRRQYQYDNYRTSYVEGNTVRKLNAVPDIQREERQVAKPSPRRQEQRHPKALSGISMASLFVLTIAIVTTLYFCVEYLKLQYGVNRMEKDIVTMEHTLTTMKNENDAAFTQIEAAYDLEYVYQVAVEELGMVYPNKNKVITYQSSMEDYVRQYEDIPE